nr:GDSL-type esterase/lipase family protein [Nocardiopsis sp. Huas11]
MTGCGGDDGASESAGTEPNYYLSLGDSLTVGVQPDENGRGEMTSQGYTDVLYRNLYDADSTLGHERMGCGGEDTTTFLEGGIPTCDEKYEGDSQLEAAEDFLSEHEGQVDLITVTIGGNNFTGCVRALDDPDGPRIDTECVDDGLERINSEVPVIAERLRTAAGPDTQIIAMTYYNPFLAALLLDDGSTGDEEAEEAEDAVEDTDGTDASAEPGEVGEGATSDDDLVGYASGVLTEMNESLRSAYAAEDIQVADVEAAFDSGDFEVPEESTTGMPANVQAVCDMTWMCDTQRGPDIHTNQAGAQQIAATFEELVQ